VATALKSGGLHFIAQLQTTSTPQLCGLLGGPDQVGLALRLQGLGWGRDTATVVAKGPAKSIQVGENTMQP
jgi:hypothetical protein